MNHNLIPYYRRQNKIKQNDLAKALNISPSYLCKIEKGLIQPTIELKQKCVEILNVDLRILFPKTRRKRTIRSIGNEFNNKLWTIRQEKGIKQNHLAKQLECSPSFLSKVEKGLQKPSEKFRKKCARVLKIKETEIFPFAN